LHKFIVVQAPAGVKLVMNRVFTRFAGVKAAAIYVMRSRKCVLYIDSLPDSDTRFDYIRFRKGFL